MNREDQILLDQIYDHVYAAYSKLSCINNVSSVVLSKACIAVLDLKDSLIELEKDIKSGCRK